MNVILKRRALCAGVLSVFLSWNAAAQDAEDIQPVNDDAAPEEAAQVDKPKGPALDEIIVTAQKRAENIQDVPISISAIGGDSIREKGISDMHNLATQTPNIDITPGSAGQIIRIRGLGSLANDGFEQSVGFYIDDIFYGRQSYISQGFLDFDRVEVLRGPQGTLFGKNTVAGAVNIHTKDPIYDWEVAGDVSAGNFDARTFTLIGNAPIIEDKLAVRLAGTLQRRDGYIYNTTRDLDIARVDKKFIRGKIKFEPIDNLDVVASVSYNKEDDTGVGFELTKAAQYSLILSRLADPKSEAKADWVGSTDAPAVTDRNTKTATLHADYTMGDHDLIFVGGWSRFEEQADIDADGLAVPILQWNNYDEYDQANAELRLVSPVGDFEYVVGLHYFYSEYVATTDFRIINADNATGLLIDILENQLPILANLTPVVSALTNALNLNQPISQLASDRLDQLFIQESNSYALFGQATWHATDRLAIVLGARLSYETKDAFISQTYVNTGLLLRVGLGLEEYELTETREEFDISPKVSVKYDLFDDVMIFGTLASGYKAGGFNPFAENPSRARFDEETSVTMETGVKAKFLDGRIRSNATYFHTKFDDLQVSVVGGTGSTFLVTNAAEATTQGVEWDLEALIFEGFTTRVALGYVDAVFDSYPNSPCPASFANVLTDPNSCDASGKPLTETPKWNISAGANMVLPLQALWQSGPNIGILFGVDMLYQSETFLNLDYDPASYRGAFVRWDARFGIIDIDGRWALIANGTNLTNRKVQFLSVDAPLQPGTHIGVLQPPRFVTVTLQITL